MASPRRISAAALAALIFLCAGTARAQQQRSLRIDDGEVYVDGRRLSPNELPASLRTEGLTLHVTSTGDAPPLIRIGDRFYLIDAGRLREADPSEQAFVGFPRPPRVANFQPPRVHVQFTSDLEPPPMPPHAVELDRQAKALDRQARELQEVERTLQQQLNANQVRQLERLAREASLHAAEAARVATDLPRIELETYLADVRRQNEGLFDRLINERRLEHDTVEMARRIQSTSNAASRRALTEELRSRLDEMFELKQDNRRNEVERLEHRLDELRERLAERARLRDEIIEQRMQELLRDRAVSH